MPTLLLRCGLLFVAVMQIMQAHAPPVYLPVPPLRVQGRQLVDAAGQPFLLRGVNMPGLESGSPSTSDLQAVRQMTSVTFRLIQQRWNANCVRLPVSVQLWRRDGKQYLDQVSAIVKLATDAGLIVVLAANDTGTQLPGEDSVAFWKTWAPAFQDNGRIIFDLYNEPKSDRIAGDKWAAWRIGMTSLVDAVRLSGARQILAVQGFHDAQGFQGIGPNYYLTDSAILYEAHPYYDVALTNSDREKNYGPVQGKFPFYAGEWGMPLNRDSPACRAVPADPLSALNLSYETLAWFEVNGVSWTVGDFRPGSLLTDFVEFSPSQLDASWRCGEPQEKPQGIGVPVLLWTTGDPSGFGAIVPQLIANAAGGAAGAIAPGELIAIYGQGLGPEQTATSQMDAAGQLPRSLAGTVVYFDCLAAPVLRADSYQVFVQVPYEVSGKPQVEMQLYYREVPSNKIKVALVDAAPEIFTRGGGNAAALNEDGSLNSEERPAARGSVMVIYASGLGLGTKELPTGSAVAELIGPRLPVTLEVGGASAQVLYAGTAPGQVGLWQVNVRLAGSVPAGQAEVVLRCGTAASRSGVVV